MVQCFTDVLFLLQSNRQQSNLDRVVLRMSRFSQVNISDRSFWYDLFVPSDAQLLAVLLGFTLWKFLVFRPKLCITTLMH